MTKELRRLSIVMLFMFLSLFVATSWIQVVEADALAQNSNNKRTRLDSYEIQRGSGGAGRWAGGDGGVRRVRFLEAMTASILSNGRHHGAFGMAGGQPGAVGINKVVRCDGRVELLDHIGKAETAPGDVFEIHTPGGGGFGAA